MKKYIILFIIIASCVNPYEYAVDNPELFLVIDGFISNRPADSAIRLSYSKPFNSRRTEEFPEAVVNVIEDETIYHPFTIKAPGYYKPEDPSFVAIEGRTYKLQITTGDKTYESNVVQIQKAAKINNLSFTTKSLYQAGEKLEFRAMDLLISTEEDMDASMYYRYFTDETWTISAPASSNLHYTPIFIYDKNNVIINIEWEEERFANITTCWRNSFTQGINIATTEGLVKNQLISVPVFTFSLHNNKLLFKYSALITQYSIPKEAYNFFFLLNKFSADDISLFDVQPGFVQGNITCISDPMEKVIGIFYASDIQEERIFIIFDDLESQDKNIVSRYKTLCETEYFIIPPNGPARLKAIKEFKDMNISEKGLVVTLLEYDQGDNQILHINSRICADCRSRGTNVKPPFWVDTL
jgi:hypothetical protein